MKKAFSLIELSVSLIVLAIALSGISRLYFHLYQNYSSVKLFERLYSLENELYETPKTRALKLESSILQTVHFTEEFAKDSLFEFTRLKAQNHDFKIYFKE
ncbi:prepilin-type N-terminal cleavage/methylation domain-containing protein [Campylobacter sp. MIT 21-1685]|uniref:type II secretion system protein n=1 Tax=unclassified Campylobacter TaxID=2593542 RepID=UPI00224B57C1|nr:MULTISPECIES: prepilin-type N-terminal cleavage/methylation domain-containing protein [unclassified Campylobacter]MCX2682925.1 prepilin-type N-terminal cleavage/methylation domain-containing protein [Campylobacter sp. MIT 21-1684]MCX2751127.1 prepilin-type N-terminal cleavage/methylation domain-containing protein [Campylobacter sp. MIT 21-1682]MCX2807406.1 prepilin-type N-terminal cleavage/methylation domain-containing protein [Campylobacter sp. MIT 21-1685]